MEISPKLCYPALPNDARSLLGRSPSRLGQGNRDDRLRRAIRRLDSVGGQAAHRIPTPLVPGRGGHGAVRRQRPPSRAPLRLGARHRREGTQRGAARGPLPRELRGARPGPQRREGPATGGRHPCPRRAPYVRRPGTQVGAAVHEPVGRRGATGLDRRWLFQGGVARRAHDAGHPQSDELPPQADPEGQAAEEDQGDRRDLRQCEGGEGTGAGRSRDAGDLDGYEGEGGPGRLRSGGKTRTDSDGEVEKGWDHDPPATAKLVPFGILMVATGALMLVFGSRETSDAWADALQMWWLQVRSGHGHIKRLVISRDNGPKNSGRRTQ